MVGAPHLQKYYVFTEFTDVVSHRGLSPEFLNLPFFLMVSHLNWNGQVCYHLSKPSRLEYRVRISWWCIYIIYIYICINMILYNVLSLKVYTWITWSHLPLQPGPHRRAQRPSPLQPWGEAGRVDGGANAGDTRQMGIRCWKHCQSWAYV